ncbi:F-box domain-containing protein/FBA_3 domain-containing protein [Cephalotus follicularis]|uniref:F-box domain-containing protein/FBA_3 domain-containing protein n=1 Tax=Cephalotus follicularis TaxID=3775 RepID=A0A1Q3ARY6_CEPFO|nr:F-box domain-containing protein/FBA_3 domain-containing protein [Cephalotus follicularis]
MESSRDLSADVIFEILSRVSMETLGRCRLVSKGCNKLSYESAFMRLYCERTRTISGYFVQSLHRSNYSSTFASINNTNTTSMPSLDFMPERVKIEASTNQGILVCVNQTYSRIPRYYVCKPCTKQWRLIPNPKTKYFTERVAMLVLRVNPLHYKIVRLSQPKISHKKARFYRCEIFDSNSWAWKRLDEINLPPNDECLSSKPAVSTGGILHWLTRGKNVLAFNVDKENWTLFSLPKSVYQNHNYFGIELVEHEGRLALVCMEKDDCMNLWVLTNINAKVWEKRQTMGIEALKRNGRVSLPHWFYTADIGLILGYEEVMFYKFNNDNINTVKLNKNIDFRWIFPFRSDLEPINLKGGQIHELSRSVQAIRTIQVSYKSIGEHLDRFLSWTQRAAFIFFLLIILFTLLFYVLHLSPSCLLFFLLYYFMF